MLEVLSPRHPLTDGLWPCAGVLGLLRNKGGRVTGEGSDEGAGRGRPRGRASGSWEEAQRFSQIWRGPRVSQVPRFSAPSGVERFFSPNAGSLGLEARAHGPGHGVERGSGGCSGSRFQVGRKGRVNAERAAHQGGHHGPSGYGGRRRSGGAASPGRPGLRREALGLRGREGGAGRATGKRGRCSKWRWGRAAGRAREETVAAMTAASGASVPAPAVSFPDLPDATQEQEPGSPLFVSVLFRQMPPAEAEHARRTRRPRWAGAQGGG